MIVQEEEEDVLNFDNPELDRRIGGLPLPSLNLIEGTNDSGKSVLAQQIVYGALHEERKVLYISTESRPQDLVDNMESLNWDVVDPYLMGYFRITFLDTLDIKWDSGIANFYLIVLINYIKQHIEQYDLVVIDSLTFLVTHAKSNDLMGFFSKCKEVVDESGKSFVITIHPYALEKSLLTRVRVICDGHLVLEKKTFRDRTALTINVSKIKGAVKRVEDMISFEVSPAYGIKILPFTRTRG